MRRRLLQMIFLGIKKFRDPYYQGFAAQISFYLLLSIVPILILLTQILGRFGLNLQMFMDWVSEYTGKEITGVLEQLTEFQPVGVAGNVIFTGTALWAASRAQFAIMRITNYTVSEGESTGRGYFRERFRAVWTMATILFTLVFALLLLAYGEPVLNMVLKLLHLDATPIMALFRWLRWLPGMVLYFLMISYIYYIMPSQRLPFRKILPGSLFASVGFLLVTIVYSKYTNSIANYDVLYGTLSSLVAILFWFYALAWVLCLGILFNKLLEDTANVSKRRPPLQ